MPSPILTCSSTIMCPHGGTVILQTTNTQLFIEGAPALLETDVHVVAGCPFMMGTVNSPCTTVRWQAGEVQTKVEAVKVLLKTSVGLCLNAAQAPQGVAIIVQTQTRVLGT